MIKELRMLLLSGVICLLGVTSVLAVEYNEAPMLRTMVAAGELPPVEERLPENPLVVKPFEKIGQYGGTASVFAINLNTWNDWQGGLSNWGGVFEQAKDGKTLKPNIAKGFEQSKDLKTFTIYLRKGAKWSDGAPFTADDIVFQFEDVFGNDELTPVKPGQWSPGGELIKAKKVNDYTVRLESSYPYPRLQAVLQTYNSLQTDLFNPKHYLKRWHIKYNPKADELAKEEGFDHWWQAFPYHAQIYSQQEDLNLPRMTPWVMKQKAANMILFERNFYYFKVDTAGNQLPYIDRVLSTIVNVETYQLKMISGKTTLGFFNTSLSNYPLYKENEEKGGYYTMLYPDIDASSALVVVGFNFNEKDLVLRKIYHDIRFRQALSLAINRDEINELLFFGQATLSQGGPHPTNSYYKKEWDEYFIEYDPEKANHLLDEMGLNRGKDGFRLRPDGKKLLLTIEMEIEEPQTIPVIELVKEYWGAVGVKTAIKTMERTLMSARMASSNHGMAATKRGYGDEILAYRDAGEFTHGNELSLFYDWWNYSGFQPDGEKYSKPGDQVTYKMLKEYNNWIQEWYKTVMGSEEYMRLAEKIFDFYSTQLWCIGVVGQVPQVFIVANTLGNIPDPMKDFTSTSLLRLQDFSDQFFFKQK